MKKWLCLLGIMLFAAGLWVFYSGHAAPSGESVRVWKGWRGTAAKDDFALAKDFLSARGIVLRVEIEGNIPLATDASDEALLIGSDTRLSKNALAELHSWVANGGHLIVLGNRELAAYFDFFVAREYPNAQLMEWQKDKNLRLQIALDNSLGFVPKSWGKHDKKHAQAPVQVLLRSDNGNPHSLQQSLGKGKLTILGHTQALWHNHSDVQKGTRIEEGKEYVPLARADNAAYLHALLEGHTKARLILAAKSERQRSFADFEWRLPDPQWWASIAAALLAVVAGLWHFGKRFGAVIERRQGSGRDMAQHFLAAGRFWARRKEYGYCFLAEQMRTRLISEVEATELVTLAAASGVSAKEVNGLISGALPKTEAEFIQFVRVAEALRSGLRRRI